MSEVRNKASLGFLDDSPEDVRKYKDKGFYVEVTGRESKCINCGHTIEKDEPKMIMQWGNDPIHKTAHLDCVKGANVVENIIFELGEHTLNGAVSECPDCGRSGMIATFVMAKNKVEAVEKAMEISGIESIEDEDEFNELMYEGKLHGKCWICVSKDMEFEGIFDTIKHRW